VHKKQPCWCVAVRDLEAAQVRLLLENPDYPLTLAETKLLKNSRTSTVAEATIPLGGGTSRVVFKRFNRKKWLDPLLTLVRPSRAWRSWQAGQHLASRGIPTPRNLAFLARRGCSWLNPLSWFLPRQTYLITAKQENVITLAEYLRKTPPDASPAAAAARTRKFNLGLARLVRALHERALSHRDLKASNILVHLDRLDTDDFLSLIDLVGVRLQNPVPRGRRIKNLARLSVSLAHAPGRTRTETLRFLRAYLPWGLSPLSDWKAVWRATEKAILAKKARNRRRGRPLS
jgi:tRNA A-37 threonylcarbamoyl transferase component Bud32